LGKILPPLESNIYINKVSQDVFIDVNEEGSEAAAVTTIGMAVPGSASPTQVLRFVANRPFFYIIRDNETRSNLFMGSVTNPEYN
jgi:serpin B